MITILGAGISGLTCAYNLHKNNIPFRLLEGSSSVGGVIKSSRKNNYLLEFGPNSTFIDTDLMTLCNELNLTPLKANGVSNKRFVYKNNKLQALPSGPLSLIFSSFFSWQSKYSIVKELNNTKLSKNNETVDAFFLRHFNQEIIDYVIDPFVSGIYACSPKELTISECFPKIIGLEKEYGSIIKGMIKTQSKNNRREIVSFPQGLQELTDTLYQKVNKMTFLNEKVISVQKTDHSWTISTTKNIYKSDYIINCLPPKASSNVFEKSLPEFSKKTSNVQSPKVSIVHTSFKKELFKGKTDGFGCLIPSKERQLIAGCIWNSSIFNYRSPKDEILLTNVITETNNHSDKELIFATIKDLERIFDLKHIKPCFTNVYHYKESIPIYNTAVKQARTFIEQMEDKNLYTATNWSKEVSVSGCIKNSIEVTKKIISLHSN